MKLVAIKKITGKIRLRSGLHIGAGKDGVEIGGLDQPIIKNPLTSEPYIPGSSLRGKMRSMLETTVGLRRAETLKWVRDGNPCGCGKRDCLVCTVFGTQGQNSETGPTRLLVGDAPLSDEYHRLFREGQLPMEVKNENSINRVTGKAENPRPLERVPAGVCFDLELLVRVYEGDDEKKMLDFVAQGLSLLEQDVLGGGGSRGSGRVKFENLALNGEPLALPTAF